MFVQDILLPETILSFVCVYRVYVCGLHVCMSVYLHAGTSMCVEARGWHLSFSLITLYKLRHSLPLDSRACQFGQVNQPICSGNTLPFLYGLWFPVLLLPRPVLQQLSQPPKLVDKSVTPVFICSLCVLNSSKGQFRHELLSLCCRAERVNSV